MNQMNRSVVFSFGLMVLITCVSFSGGRAPEKGEKAQEQAKAGNTDNTDEEQEKTREKEDNKFRDEKHEEKVQNAIKELKEFHHKLVTRDKIDWDSDEFLLTAEFIDGVGRTKDPRVLPYLLDVIKTEKFGYASYAINAIAQMKKEYGVPALEEVIRHSSNAMMRASAANRLIISYGENEAGLKALKKELKNKDPNVRLFAAGCLMENAGEIELGIEELKKQKQISGLYGCETVKGWIQYSDYRDVVMDVVNYDFEVHLPDRKLEPINKETKERRRATAGFILAKHGEKDLAYDVLMDSINSDDYFELGWFLSGMEAIGGKQAIDAVKKLLERKDLNLLSRSRAEEILEKLKGK